VTASAVQTVECLHKAGIKETITYSLRLQIVVAVDFFIYILPLVLFKILV
jgi:hypothetical protein